MRRKVKSYYKDSNYQVYVDRAKNLASIEITYPLGSRELDNIIALLEATGYLTTYYTDKKGIEVDKPLVDNLLKKKEDK